jgi:hypothetical protein
VIEATVTNIGATILGRNMFGGHLGPRHAEQPCRRPAPSLPAASARRTIGRSPPPPASVAFAGGAEAARQYLNAGLVDEMELHLVPVLLGRGEPLLDGIRDPGGRPRSAPRSRPM